MATTNASSPSPPTTAAVNGISAPSLHLDAVGTAKRKREDENDAVTEPAAPVSRTQHVQRDILEVLQRLDTTPSLLTYSITESASDEPSQKKARLSDQASANSTIASKLKNSSYDSLDEIKVDAALVCEEIVSSIRTKPGEKNGRPSVEELKQIHRVQMMEAMVKEIVDKEDRHQKDVGVKKEDQGLPNGHAQDIRATLNGTGIVLTLFGNAPTPKQLFSSLQHSPSSTSGQFLTFELPIEEMSMPNGISATKIVAAPSEDKKGPTFEDSFAPPHTLAPLNPPKGHKKSSTRDMKVAWEFRDPVQRNKKGGATVQPLTAGHWLGYGGVDAVDGTSSQKRKQRSRALSINSESAEPAISEEAMAKVEEALFRRAYSSFAPTCDNSNAVIPDETKNLVWWHKTGSRRFNDTFAIDPALIDDSEPSSTIPPPFDLQTYENEDFGTVMEELDELDRMEIESDPVKSKTDVEQVLREISDLLETLASHQRIRSAALPSARESIARTPISPAPIVASKIGRPDEPSDEEYSTYESLRRELAYLILKLPPYAVAKLDGDQLADLGVSKLIQIQANDRKGTMEEDQVARQAKFAALATATSIATLARPNSSAGQHYNQTANRTPAIGQAANTRYGQQYGTRTPSAVSSFQRQSSGHQTYSTPVNAAPRPNYPQAGHWGRSGVAQQGYSQTNGQQSYQRSQQAPNNHNQYNQQWQTPQAQRFNSQSAQIFQQPRSSSQNAAANAIAYQASPASQSQPQPQPQQTFPGTVSPAKGYPAVSMGPAQNQPRPIYPGQSIQHNPGSGRATPVSYPSQPHTPVNGYQPPQRQPQGIAPRPSSLTPQPPPHQAPLPPQTSAVQTNGT